MSPVWPILAPRTGFPFLHLAPQPSDWPTLKNILARCQFAARCFAEVGDQREVRETHQVRQVVSWPTDGRGTSYPHYQGYIQRPLAPQRRHKTPSGDRGGGFPSSITFEFPLIYTYAASRRFSWSCSSSFPLVYWPSSLTAPCNIKCLSWPLLCISANEQQTDPLFNTWYYHLI